MSRKKAPSPPASCPRRRRRRTGRRRRRRARAAGRRAARRPRRAPRRGRTGSSRSGTPSRTPAPARPRAGRSRACTWRRGRRRVAVDDAERARRDAVAAAVAHVGLQDHGVELGADERAGRAGVQAAGVRAVLADVGHEDPVVHAATAPTSTGRRRPPSSALATRSRTSSSGAAARVGELDEAHVPPGGARQLAGVVVGAALAELPPSAGRSFHCLQATSHALQPMQTVVSVKKPIRSAPSPARTASSVMTCAVLLRRRVVPGVVGVARARPRPSCAVDSPGGARRARRT